MNKAEFGYRLLLVLLVLLILQSFIVIATSSCDFHFTSNPKDDLCTIDNKDSKLFPSCYMKKCCSGVGECKRCDGLKDCSCQCKGHIIIGSPKQEDCNDKDDDCDGFIDNGLIHGGTSKINYAPLNSIQEGVCKGSRQSCSLIHSPHGWVDDYNGIFHYEMNEVTCDGLDNDCDGIVDEGCDSDLDGFIDANLPCSTMYRQPRCVDELGYEVTCQPNACKSGFGVDCNDQDYLVASDMSEICDTKDNDCDGKIDEGCDMDGDGYVSPEQGCEGFFINSKGEKESCVKIRYGKQILALDCDDNPLTGSLIINRYLDAANNRVCADGIWVNLS